MINLLSEVFFKEFTGAELLEELKVSVSVECLIAKDAQESYDIFRIIRAELVKREVEVPKTQSTGSLISRRIISVIWKGADRINALKRYDVIKLELSRKRRETDSGVGK